MSSFIREPKSFKQKYVNNLNMFKDRIIFVKYDRFSRRF